MTGIGLLFALAASVANAFAIVLQAAEARLAPGSLGGRPSLLLRLARRRRWLAGLALTLIAWPLQLVALSLAPITVVQPALTVSLLILLAVARTRLHERVGPVEVVGALAIVVGVTAIVLAAPRHDGMDPEAVRAAVPLLLVGGAAILCYASGRFAPNRRLSFVIGAGLAYGWVDFVNKLLADDLSTGRWPLAALWLAATLCFGALAFLQETSALQSRPAVTVTPVVGAIQDPLAVLMALWVGVESWGAGASHLVPLVGGLAAVTAGGVLLGRSSAVARASSHEQARPTRARHAPAGCLGEPIAE